MEESLKIQEEFENLIEQLERLKNINELTSANTESSQQVIKEMDKFISSTNEYKKKIEEDLSLKSQSIDKLIIHIENSIHSIEKQSQSLPKNINSAFELLKDETKSSFVTLSEVVSNKIEINQKSIEHLKNILLAKIENTENNLIESSIKQFETLKNVLAKNKTDISNRFENQEKEIKSLRTFLLIISGLILMGIIVMGTFVIIIKFPRYF
jgi:hypothetical protein